jgi:nitroreductase
MEFSELVRLRYSCRAYRREPIDETVLGRILEAGRLAPTAANRQPFRIVVVTTATRQEALARVYARGWLREAPLILAVVGVPGEAWVRKDGRSHMDVDCAIVMDHLVLAAANEGLGTCWVANFDVAAARALLELGPDEVPLLLSPLGAPADQPGPKERKSLAHLVRRLS